MLSLSSMALVLKQANSNAWAILEQKKTTASNNLFILIECQNLIKIMKRF